MIDYTCLVAMVLLMLLLFIKVYYTEKKTIVLLIGGHLVSGESICGIGPLQREEDVRFTYAYAFGKVRYYFPLYTSQGIINIYGPWIPRGNASLTEHNQEINIEFRNNYNKWWRQVSELLGHSSSEEGPTQF